ncbi:hypothetical protein [Erysipelothrix larvae]|nr:hypothetical protein [Erysipelothrix larvae]
MNKYIRVGFYTVLFTCTGLVARCVMGFILNEAPTFHVWLEIIFGLVVGLIIVKNDKENKGGEQGSVDSNSSEHLQSVYIRSTVFAVGFMGASTAILYLTNLQSVKIRSLSTIQIAFVITFIVFCCIAFYLERKTKEEQIKP